MIRMECDYLEGAEPHVLEALIRTNGEQHPGYSTDALCERARGRVRAFLDAPDADVHFLVGGTQTNTVVIDAALRPHQGVLTAASGHINMHESGAIEACRHKVLALPCVQGKITAEAVEQALCDQAEDASFEHIVQPAMVYLSWPTECGTLYSRQELFDLYDVCRRHDIPLYIDGARLGYGLASPACDLTAAEIMAHCDVMYIGGTKIGLLFGEALAIRRPALKKDIRYLIKQHGGLLAKGRLLGAQFDAILEDDRYLAVSRHAVTEALRIREAFLSAGVALYFDSMTNQQFPILTRAELDAFDRGFTYDPWTRLPDGRWAVRFCTSWATRTEDVDLLLAEIPRICRRGGA